VEKVTTKHSKHAKLTRREMGSFAPIEISWVGAPCSMLEQWMRAFQEHTRHTHHTCLIDADHNSNVSGKIVLEEERIWTSGESVKNAYFDKIRGIKYDLALVNGNHYPASHQVVFISHAKEKSVLKRMDEIENPLCYILQDKEEIHDFLPNVHSGDPLKAIPVFREDQQNEVFNFLKEWTTNHIPTVRGLILAGGKSLRMGEDKSELVYKNLSAVEWMAGKFPESVQDIFISKAESGTNDGRIIPDRFLGLGPLGAIASAFLENPNKALMVVACDLPLLDPKRLVELLEKRNPSKVATAFRLSSKEFPEPLVAIYEPKALAYFLDFLLLGYSCPRKVLINSPIEEILSIDEDSFFNMNTPEDLAYVQSKIG
jgi:molybdopterin-guanine dinucleotide biosynthesis protein A